jgi:hypothetical protein
MGDRVVLRRDSVGHIKGDAVAERLYRQAQASGPRCRCGQPLRSYVGSPMNLCEDCLMGNRARRYRLNMGRFLQRLFNTRSYANDPT